MWTTVLGFLRGVPLNPRVIVAGVVCVACVFFGWWLRGGQVNRLEQDLLDLRLDYAQSSLLERDRQAQLLVEKNATIGELNDAIAKAHADLAAANDRGPVIKYIRLRPKCPSGVPAAGGSGSSAGSTGTDSGSDAPGGTGSDPGVLVQTSGLRAIAQRGDACLIDLKGWRDYAKVIGAVH
jgi:hypothetical protein